MGRETSDEAYVLDLCDEVLGPGSRQHRFDWLLGDPGKSGRRVRLPVDGYWDHHGIVVEYREQQHDRPNAHFDKPDTLTVSGVHRGVQRALYDARRDGLIPARGLRLVVITPSDLAANSRGRLKRDRQMDSVAVARLIQGHLVDSGEVAQDAADLLQGLLDALPNQGSRDAALRQRVEGAAIGLETKAQQRTPRA